MNEKSDLRLLILLPLLLLLFPTMLSCRGSPMTTDGDHARTAQPTVGYKSPAEGTDETANPSDATSTDEPERKGGDNEIMTLTVTSSAFRNGEMIPMKYTGDGDDVSPPLKWNTPPEGAKSIVIICDDPDAPVGVWDHWVLYNLKPEITDLNEDVPREKTLSNGALQGKNSWGKIGYGGPSPPRGKPHRYFFRVYAVDRMPDLGAGMNKNAVLGAIKGHVLAQGELMGTYQR